LARASAPDRRSQILEALFAAMAEGGTAGASITEIADRAGVARGALHYFFDNKDDITAALMQRLGDRYLERLTSSFARNAATRGVADVLARFHFGADDETMTRLLGVWIDYWGQAPSRPDIQRIVASVQSRTRQLLGEYMAPKMAPVVLAVVEGALLQWRVGLGNSNAISRHEWHDHLHRAVTLLCAAPIPSTLASMSRSHFAHEQVLEAP
jgi:TetR/AcrR family transcriptional regulator, fatty acid metabolism regulator protein